MAPFPVKELEYAEDLARQYEEAQGPFVVRAAGQPDLYVVSELDFEWDEPAYTEEQLAQIKAGYDDMKAGRCVDAFEALEEIRAKYGL